ncbi:MAG: hypothetical protein HFJ34_07235 [Clostridia bacterium]|nr:hypothetical protein [Clostridia bacterium]
MKTFFSSTFIKEETLNEARINYPVKLEYYKIINKEKNLEKDKAKFGIYILMKEYKKEGVKKGNSKMQHITNDEKQVEEIMNTLEKNEVTPGGLKDVVKEMFLPTF